MFLLRGSPACVNLDWHWSFSSCDSGDHFVFVLVSHTVALNDSCHYLCKWLTFVHFAFSTFHDFCEVSASS